MNYLMNQPVREVVFWKMSSNQPQGKAKDQGELYNYISPKALIVDRAGVSSKEKEVATGEW